jgi:hypothetical protein
MQDTSPILIVEFFGFYGLITSDSDFFPWFSGFSLSAIFFQIYGQFLIKIYKSKFAIFW